MGTVARTPDQVKAALRARGCTYRDVARVADRSWYMVWAVVNRRKTSAHVLRAVEKVTGVRVVYGSAG